MNFLAEVLLTAEEVELIEVQEKLPDLELKVIKIKTELMEYMENVYGTFNERPRQNKVLLKEVDTLDIELKHLKQNIENIKKKQSTDTKCEIEKYIVKLNSVSNALNILLKFYQINEDLIDFDRLWKFSEFLSCMKIVIKLENLSKQICAEPKVKFFKQIQFQILRKKETLLIKLSDVFSENISIKIISENNYLLRIKKESKNLQLALEALHLNGSAISHLSNLTKLIWKYFINPVVINVIQLEIKDDEYFNIIEITIDNSDSKPQYSKVFYQLEKIFEFLKTYFELYVEDNMSTIKLIGDDIRNNLAELIIEQCLKDTVPTISEELNNYETVVQKTVKFEETLKLYGIFCDTTNMLTNFVNQIDKHYFNNKFKQYIQISDTIMKKDLHDIKEVGIPYDPHNLNFTQSSLPLCCVSKSAIEFTDFIRKIVPQDHSPSETSNKLICIIKIIIKNYGYLVPQYHSKLLETIPQQVAIFQNNCFYISHELTKINEKLKLHSEIAHYDFIVEATILQQIGLKCFTKFVNKTKDSIIIEGIEGPVLKDLSPEAEKSVQQCMRQQELLKTVWHKVLPYKLYNRTMGNILHHMCQGLITCVTSIEDISSKAAEQLIEIFKLVITRGPKLFSDAKEIYLFVPNWYKFNELNFILSAALIDIYDRWTDDKSPLALQFSSKEIKLLIRALFQNSERRATILAKI